jgi:hypothetical protein
MMDTFVGWAALHAILPKQGLKVNSPILKIID